MKFIWINEELFLQREKPLFSSLEQLSPFIFFNPRDQDSSKGQPVNS